MSPGSRALAASAALAATLGARGAFGYCQSATCPTDGQGDASAGQVCNPSLPTDCGIPLQWRQPCVSFDVQQDASVQVDYATADAVLTRAFAAWAAVDCGGGPPTIQVFDFGPVACTEVQYNQHGGNANILIFRDTSWPHDTGGGGVDTLALTTVTYDVDTGDLYDADIEVNTASNTFTTDDDPGPADVDLLAVLTHETGHFLGLAHTQDPNATMFASYTMGTTTIRNLSDDDGEAICAAYPLDRTPAGACTGLPRHGWASVCFGQQTDLSCAASTDGGGQRRGDAVMGSALALCALALGIRARRGSRGS